MAPSIAVLLVEDNVGDARLIEELLRDTQATATPMTLHHVGRLSDALEQLTTAQFDLVLLDLSLPDSQGLAAVSTVHTRMPMVPLIVLTGLDDEVRALEAVRLGAQDYVVKGQLDGRGLLRSIRYAIERKELQRLKDEFVSMVSHELRTPLTVIKESIGLICDGTTGAINAEQQDFLDTAKRNVDRLARLINNVLDYQKLEAGRMTFHPSATDLNALVEETRKHFTPVARQKGLALAVQLAPACPTVLVDRDAITQVLVNFLNNAVKFTAQGTVTVSTTCEADAIRVAVCDQGVGIKESDLDKLFRSFSQIDTDGNRATGGTGLGLAISKKIIEQHRGRVGVTSRYGEGSTFYFTLPVETVGAAHG